jgi:hypothetical protein
MARWIRKSIRSNIILAVILTVVSLAATLLPIVRKQHYRKVAPQLERNEEFRSAAEYFIERVLKAPATARFAPDAEWSFETIDQNTLRMAAWVDAQNLLGVYLRHPFTAIVSLNRGADKWRLRYLN